MKRASHNFVAVTLANSICNHCNKLLNYKPSVQCSSMYTIAYSLYLNNRVVLPQSYNTVRCNPSTQCDGEYTQFISTGSPTSPQIREVKILNSPRALQLPILV